MSAGGADPETITALVNAQGRALTKSYTRLGQHIAKVRIRKAPNFAP